MSREDVEEVLHREASCADRVIIANRKLVSRSEPPRSGFLALAELVRLDARLVDDAKCRGKRAASKEAALILAVGLRRGAGNSKLRFQLLAMRCAMVQHLRFIMTERGKLLDEAIALLDGLTAPLIRRIKGIRRQLESFRPKTPSATASRSRAQHTQGLREALEEMLLLQRQLRQVDELGLSTFKPLSKLVLARAAAAKGRSLELLADDPLSLPMARAPRQAFHQLNELLVRARRAADGDEEMEGVGQGAAAASAAVAQPMPAALTLVVSPHSGKLRPRPSSALVSIGWRWQDAKQRWQAAERAGGVVRDAQHTKLLAEQEAKRERAAAIHALEEAQRALHELAAKGRSRAQGTTGRTQPSLPPSCSLPTSPRFGAKPDSHTFEEPTLVAPTPSLLTRAIGHLKASPGRVLSSSPSAKAQSPPLAQSPLAAAAAWAADAVGGSLNAVSGLLRLHLARAISSSTPTGATPTRSLQRSPAPTRSPSAASSEPTTVGETRARQQEPVGHARVPEVGMGQLEPAGPEAIAFRLEEPNEEPPAPSEAPGEASSDPVETKRTKRRVGVSLSIEAGSVPERRGKFTLPGGKPAFTPGWDEQPVIEDDEAELRAEIEAELRAEIEAGQEKMPLEGTEGEVGTLTREEVPTAGVAEVMKGLLRDLSHSIATLQPEAQQSVPHARARAHSTFPTGLPKSASLASLAQVKPGRAPLASIGVNGIRALPPSVKGRAQTTASKAHTLNAFERPTMMRVDGLAKGSVSRLSII